MVSGVKVVDLIIKISLLFITGLDLCCSLNLEEEKWKALVPLLLSVLIVTLLGNGSPENKASSFISVLLKVIRSLTRLKRQYC